MPSKSQSPTSDASTPQPELFALFRNSHLAVLYRHADALYTLVTDQVFLNEPSVVWERLQDVDQGAAVFVDGVFELATPVGGDWAGWTPASEAPGVVNSAECVLPTLLATPSLIYGIVTNSHCSCRTQRTSTRDRRVPSGRRSVWLGREQRRRRSVRRSNQGNEKNIKRTRTIIV